MKTILCISSLLLLSVVIPESAVADQWELLGLSGEDVICVAVHPASSDTIYAGTSSGMYRSVDGGVNWDAVGSFSGIGLISFNQRQPNIIFVESGLGLYRSTNCGNSWELSAPFSILSFTIDQNHPNRLYAGSSRGLHIQEAWIGLSTDGGDSWTEVETGAYHRGDIGYIGAIAVNPLDTNVVYMGMVGGWDYPGRGVFKSIDGGLTWEEMSSGLYWTDVNCLVVDPINPMIVYAGTSGLGGYVQSQGIFKTMDGGLNWEPINNGIPEMGGCCYDDVQTLIIDPVDHHILYACTWAGYNNKGVFVTVDGGLGWRVLGEGLGSTGSHWLALDPSDRNVIYSAWGGVRRYTRTTSCVDPEIISYDPALINLDNCDQGCTVSFDIQADSRSSEVAVIALERRIGQHWIEEDFILSPDSGQVWTLSCTVDGHFTDGQHKFRAVARCNDGSRCESPSVYITADRGVSVTFSGFNVTCIDGRASLHWIVNNDAGLKGFNIYRSLRQNSGYQKLNQSLVPAGFENEYLDSGLEPGRTYWYIIGADCNDDEWFTEAASLTVPAVNLALFQNYPNPFNPITNISFTLPARGAVSLKIYDVQGRIIRTLLNHVLDEGYGECIWDGTDDLGVPVSSGIYFYHLKAEKQAITKKMMLLK